MTLRPDDIEPGLPPEDKAALAQMAVQLEMARPVPAAHYRGNLRRQLLEPRESPLLAKISQRRHLAVGSCAIGSALLLVAAAGLVGLGPFTPGDVDTAVVWALSNISGPLRY